MSSRSSAKMIDLKQSSNRSVLWVVAATLLAMLLGWLLWFSVSARTNVVEHGGVKAGFPVGWLVQKGIAGEQMVFSGSNPLDPTLRYVVNMLPSGETIHFSDLVFNRNLQRGQTLDSYVVLDQTEVKFNGEKAFRVHFAYVMNYGNETLPQVIEGVDYYWLTLPNAMVITLEERTDLYEQAVPRFNTFVSSVVYTPGGGQ